MSKPEDYSVGWICSQKTEQVAAGVLLDEEHERLFPSNNNNYTLGRIGNHNVAVAVLPSGDYSTSSAAIVATHMQYDFPNIAFFLMVVIGGGAPNQYHDVRLGDIVVGRDGVLEYNEGKVVQDQPFHITARSVQPPAVLRTAVNELMAQYETKGHRFEKFIYNILKTNPRLRGKYMRPDPDRDRLYRSEVVHPGGTSQSCEAVCSGDPSNLIPRPVRADEDDNPAIHYGLIASANQLMKDALVRDQIAAQKDVLCFDIGSAGVANHFPCLVILGVCDYSDSHKNTEWQGYAALAAAIYARDLLYRISPSKMDSKKRIGDNLSNQQTSATSATGFSSDEEEVGGSLEAAPTITSRREVAFDSAEVMSVNDTPAAQSAANKWFTDRDLMNKVDRCFLQYRKKPTPKNQIIKIAILDTGIDLDHPEFRPCLANNQISNGYCADFVNPGESPISDSTGHGTHCTHLILKVCKTARIYAAKVFQTDEGDEGAAERIPKALKWAVESGVDIIVLCFAFTQFHDAIFRAIRESKGQREFLIFAAASNNKHDLENPVGFPACVDDVIRVNSCTYKGFRSSFSPVCHDEIDSLSTIGEELQAAFPPAKNGNQSLKRMSGTSMATAILAGVAGLVLEFSRMERKNGPNVKHQERLLLTKGMVAVLRGCMAGSRPPQPPLYCYIRPWLLFAPEDSREDIVHRISAELRRCI